VGLSETATKPTGSSRDLPAVGSLVAGKYRLERIIGEGGMGVVYEAVHQTLGQRLAVKVLHPRLELADEVVSRFQREARAAARLESAHIARVLDVDLLDDGTPFMVMELLEGSDLDHELETRGTLPPYEAARIIVEACAAMAEAHAHRIVHRDLKPANLFLASVRGERVVKVLDFGISKVQSDENVSMTMTQSVFGTPIYMSPEHVRSAKHVDARSDVWSLGVILYEAISGKAPFDGDSVTALAAAISIDKPKPLGSVTKTKLPEGFEAVVMRALEKDPSQRHASATALAAALRPFVDERTRALVDSLVRTYGGVSVEAGSPRPRALWLGVGIGALAGVGALVAVLVTRARAEREVEPEPPRAAASSSPTVEVVPSQALTSASEPTPQATTSTAASSSATAVAPTARGPTTATPAMPASTTAAPSAASVASMAPAPTTTAQATSAPAQTAAPKPTATTKPPDDNPLHL
jgi:serine/threonine protein kinase